MFEPVPSRVSFPQLEEKVLRFWRESRIFEKSSEQREGAPLFVLYEGPPTANASPGIHHVLSRAFKDIIPRYKTMQGYRPLRKAGWDTHGLPVELEVENELGLKSKRDIEAYGVAEFNARCRQSVMSYVKEWGELTQRIGFWLDMKHPYITFENDYIETCWWMITRLWDEGLVYQGYKVTPHCPRCETSLSSHEVALGYKDDAEDRSIYVKFRLQPGSVATTALDPFLNSFLLKPAYLLAWTTTPWTLPGNTALAVAPDAEYLVMEGIHDYLIMASALVDRVGLEGYREVASVKGTDIAGVQKGVRYEPLFNPHKFGVERRRFRLYYTAPGFRAALEIQPEDKDLTFPLTFPVIDADFVSLDEGTGIVHIAPAFGQVDFEAGEDNDLDFVQPVDLQGRMTGTYPFAGLFVKDADPLIIADLESRGLMYRSERIVHTYPFCWRCDTPLLYYAKTAWYIRTTAKKDRLISANQEINWYPEHIKYGRFGDWLEGNVDWACSRERYWGTPLPIWRCPDCGRQECVGGVKELKEKPGLEGLEEPLDLHRPFVDRVTFACTCGGRMQRTPEVLDCWFDSGAMPLAQWHYPFENQGLFQDGRFPADYICEAVDQTRGWFYSLHALSTLLLDRPCFDNVICLGHILDLKGEKMSKSKGNVVAPWSIINAQGADALRWYLYTACPPGNVRRFAAELVEEALRKFLLTLWNTYSFFVTYANIDKFDPRQATDPGYRSELDRWIISELNQLIAAVSTALDHYDPNSAGRRIEDFVDNLSNWYVRRSRRRFWKSESDVDKQAAYLTLYRCLTTLAKVLAPFTPFIAEEMYQNLVRSVDTAATESVHLDRFPVADPSEVDEALSSDTRLVMKVTSLGRNARSRAEIKVRQPLARVAVKVRTKYEREGLDRLRPQVLEELNVKDMVFVDEEQELAKPGYSLARDDSLVVAVATEITPELEREGLARELVHRVQTMRRAAGFYVTDHITNYVQGGPDILREAIQQFGAYIRQETLSRELVLGEPPPEAYPEIHTIAGHEVTLAVQKAPPSA